MKLKFIALIVFLLSLGACTQTTCPTYATNPDVEESPSEKEQV